MEITCFGVKPQINPFSIVTNDVLGTWVLIGSPPHKFLHSKHSFHSVRCTDLAWTSSSINMVQHLHFSETIHYNIVNWTNLSILNGVTRSGKVIFCAMDLGTPTWSILKLGSGVMTVLAEKSTRFPIKFPLTRPSFPFSLCLTDFSGRPDFWTAWNSKLHHTLLH